MNIVFQSTGEERAVAEVDLDLFTGAPEVRRRRTVLDQPGMFECRLDGTLDDHVSVFEHRTSTRIPLTASSGSQPPVLSFCLCLGGGIHYRFETMAKEERWREGAANLWLCGGATGYSRQDAGSRTHLMDVVLSAEGLSLLVDLDPELLGPLADAMRTGDTFRVLRQDIPIDPAIHRAAHALLESDAMGRGARAYRRSKLLELFALFLRWDRPGGDEATASLSAYDMERLTHARFLLLERMLDPPTIPELARLAGTNECKLKRGFRQLFGDTVFGILATHRMEHARRLLLDTDEPIRSVAIRCGFEHPSHFSTAFRRHAGCAPLEFRKGNAASIHT